MIDEFGESITIKTRSAGLESSEDAYEAGYWDNAGNYTATSTKAIVITYGKEDETEGVIATSGRYSQPEFDLRVGSLKLLLNKDEIISVRDRVTLDSVDWTVMAINTPKLEDPSFIEAFIERSND